MELPKDVMDKIVRKHNIDDQPGNVKDYKSAPELKEYLEHPYFSSTDEFDTDYYEKVGLKDWEYRAFK